MTTIFEDTKAAIRRRKSNKSIHYNGQKDYRTNNDLQNITKQTIEQNEEY